MHRDTRSALYLGHVRHARYSPRRHRFDYRVFSMLINLDSIDREAKNLALFSVNRWNIFSFHFRDHGFCDTRSPRQFVDATLAEHKLPPADQIYLLCYPRLFGYVFNPLSVYYVETDNRLTALIYEVRNTFGESHVYFTSLADGQSEICHTHDKAFHVSPFIGMSAQYAFSADRPAENLRLVIRERVEDRPLLITSFIGRRQSLTTKALIGALIKYPLMTVKIIAAIHYEALRLWLKRVPVFKKPKSLGNTPL